MASPLAHRVDVALEGLTPGYFALVMATGIVSVGLQLEGFELLSRVLLAVCLTGFVVLGLLTVIRFVRFRRAMAGDFLDPKRAFGYFTYVAGTNVLGVRLFMEGYHTVTAVFLALTATAWAVMGYVIPWTAVLGKVARPVVASANGTWFIWVVASQSVAVAAATLEPVSATATHGLSVLAVVAWSVGVFLYAAAGVIVTLRMLLYDLRPEDLDPPYWVAMGACAITVLAGARIVEMAAAPMVDATRGLVAGLSVVFWSFATWLIPVLFAAGLWRHWLNRVPLRYEATLWSMVFPLGMYAVAGIYLGRADRLPLVGWIGRVELWLAFAVLLVVLTAMLRHVVVTVLRPAATAETDTAKALVRRDPTT
ncbi:tellurite resistance/C4-dicarboxylate transporter family protein [Ornithinimicrobium cavernae]|uniref:tellurite resistance/C4-dicarboxylate transporter family protein n=1 Tax=Ornithinimicrobium cavernae TaxID=2666047 RepID=UPI001F212D1F|nr:tellurite resistance/C4-dicarboxylate transporter family protein [Ornithinimicrobium cavernae]